VPKIIEKELGLTKLLQKQNGAFSGTVSVKSAFKILSASKLLNTDKLVNSI